MNTTHTVKIEAPPSRVLRFLVGIALLWAVWACRGLIFQFCFNAMRGGDPNGLGSVTAIVLPLAIEFVIMLGSIAIFIGSLGWGVFMDVVGGIATTVQAWRSKSVAVQSATYSATEAATVAGMEAAGAAASASAVAQAKALSPPSGDLSQFIRDVQSTLREQRDQIVLLTKALEARPKPAARGGKQNDQ